MLAQTSKRAAAFFSILNSSRNMLKTKFGTLACPAALNLGRSQAALLVNPYHTGQAVPRAAVGFLSAAMHDFSGEVVPLKMWGQPPSAVRGAQLRCGRRMDPRRSGYRACHSCRTQLA